MSWSIVREATDLLLTKSIIKDLEIRLSKDDVINGRSSWLSSSNYAINNIKKNVVGNKVKKDLLKSVYYLRCLFYWKTNNIKSLENELTNVIFEEFPEEPIFNFIQGALYIQIMHPMLKNSKKNKKDIVDNLNHAFIFFNKALIKSEDFEIKVAINWSLAWMYHITQRNEKFRASVKYAKENDNRKFGLGWALWLNWTGRNLSDEDILFLSKQI